MKHAVMKHAVMKHGAMKRQRFRHGVRTGTKAFVPGFQQQREAPRP